MQIEVKQQYIVWIDCGHDGWGFNQAETLQECLAIIAGSYGRQCIVTKPIHVELVELQK